MDRKDIREFIEGFVGMASLLASAFIVMGVLG